jgi:penicillin-binding protein A
MIQSSGVNGREGTLARMRPERRRRLLRRGIPALAALAALTILVLALMVGGESEAEQSASRFASAWERGDRDAMYAQLTGGAKARTSRQEFERAYEQARLTATIVKLEAGDPEEDGGDVRLPLRIETYAFGTIRRDLLLPVGEGGVAWLPHHVFPGVPEGATLRRSTEAPPRARILARGGRAIAAGPAGARISPLGIAGTAIAGQVAPPQTPEQERSLEERGFPPGTAIGLNGLERIVEPQVAGIPGGTLSAGGVTLARTRPREAQDVRTTIDARVQEAAVTALAGRLGGIAALDPSNGEVRALAGIAFSAPQPPGSTFKIVTAVGALEAGLVELGTKFPVETRAVIDGVDLENANQESCGGTFINSFAHSCNSVFGPLGVRLGAKRLVETAERFGFNRDPRVAGAQPSTIPPAEQIGSPLAVASTAIGQGQVLATPLELASMAQTIAARGLRYEPALLAVSDPRGTRVTSEEVARQVGRMMVAVVRYGTGTAASLPSVRVAGKTGTAELESTQGDEVPDAPSEEAEPPGSDTDAWFAAYAPAARPRLAVAVLLVRGGAVGETAAPAAKTVLQAGLARGG